MSPRERLPRKILPKGKWVLMDLCNEILTLVLAEPGSSTKKLALLFGLTDYRLHRAFRHIQRDLDGRRLIHDDANGVWIVEMSSRQCSGIDWAGTDAGGYVQCGRSPQFPDGRCYHHSDWESAEMVAFERRIRTLVGPADPSVRCLSRLSMAVVEELIDALRGIRTMTLRHEQEKDRLFRLLKAALAFLKWKDLQRLRSQQRQWIPPEYLHRFRQSSSGNVWEHSLRQQFLVLQVPTTATREEVLKAWRRLARLHHPDAASGDDERMKAINLAKDRIFRLRRWG